VVPSPKPMVTVEVIKNPPKVVHWIEDVAKSIALIPKVVIAMTTHEKLIVVPLSIVSKVAATISELSAVDIVNADVVKDVVEEVVPLSGLNMQLKRVHDETCMTVDRG
jgi:C4-dicarboxylate transporter